VKRITPLWLVISSLCVMACAGVEDRPPTLAFVGVNLIAAYGEPHREDQTVLVRGDRIVAVGPANRVRVPAGARRLATGGRILAPGLTDMHVHIFEANDGVLFLANGVTTVRNLRGRAETAALQAQIETGAAPGPYIYSSTPIIDGPQPAWDNARVVRSAEEMRLRIEEQQGHGYVGAKLYENLSPEAFIAGVEAARAHGMPVYAHVPHAMTLEEVLVLRIDSIEHLTGFDRALATNAGNDWDEERWAEADMRNLDQVARSVVASGVWNDSTLITSLGVRRAFADMATAESAPLYRYATPRLRRHWRAIQAMEAEQRDPSEAWAMTQRAHSARLAVVRALHDAGAPLLFGTDAPQPFVYPGYSLLDELDLHRDAGLSAAEILRADTLGAAQFLREQEEFGRIEVGARADLILVDSNPEADLAALRSPAGVMAAGRWYDADTLQQMLDAVAASIAASLDAEP
jgi:imidazolonepropionase-like amidohydrolase